MTAKFPKLQTLTYVDYHDMARYIDEKYGISQRDYEGKWAPGAAPSARHLDFWHWMIANCFVDLKNGCYERISFVKASEIAAGEGDKSEWVVAILSLYLREFPEFWAGDERGYFNVYVGW